MRGTIALVVAMLAFTHLAGAETTCTRLDRPPEYPITSLLPELDIVYVHRLAAEDTASPPRWLLFPSLIDDTQPILLAEPDGHGGIETRTGAMTTRRAYKDRPWSVYEADFDGDGIADLLVNWYYTYPDPSPELFRGRGDGTFTPGQAITIPLWPGSQSFVRARLAADVDGDGRAEIVSLIERDWVNRFLVTHEWDASGTWRFEIVVFTFLDGPMDHADVDDDGIDDVILQHENYLAVHFGDRVTPLGSARSTSIGEYWADAQVLDGRRGPGPVRLLLAPLAWGPLVPSYGRVATIGSRGVLYDPGTATAFAPQGQIPDRYPTAADFDRDGTGEVRYRVRAPGSSSSSPAVGYALLEADDMGGLEVVATHYATFNVIEIFDADGDGDDEHLVWDGSAVVIREPGVDVYARSPVPSLKGSRHVVGDFDADGRDDLLVLSPTAELSLLRAVGDGHFAAQPVEAPRFFIRELEARDFDHDGSLDLVAWGTDSTSRNHVAWAWGRGSGAFSAWTEVPGVPEFGSIAVSVGDLDGDRRTDLVVDIGGSSREVRPHLQTGDGFVAAPPLRIPGGALIVGDVDGDTRDDLVVVGNRQNPRWYRSQGGGDFAPAVTSPETVAGYFTGGLVADLDRDGRADLLLSGASIYDGGSVLTMKGDGRGGFRRLWQGPDDRFRSEQFADLDGDGLVDLITADDSATHGFAYLADGAGGFVRDARGWHGVPGQSIAPGRFSGPLPDLARYDAWGQERVLQVARQRVPLLESDLAPPRVEVALRPDIDVERNGASTFTGIWRVAAVAKDECSAAWPTSLVLALPDLSMAPRPLFERDALERIEIYEEVNGGTPRVTLFGPDEARLRARYEAARARGGFVLEQNTFLRLVSEEHTGPPSGAWGGIPRAYEFAFDAHGVVSSAKAQGPGRDLAFDVTARDATGKTSAARDAFRAARARYCVTHANQQLCR